NHLLFNKLEYLFGQLQQTEQVRNRRAVLSYLLSQVAGFIAGQRHQALVGSRLFNGAQVFTLDVLDQRDLSRTHVVEVLNDGGDLLVSDQLRGSPATLSRNDEITIAFLAHDDGLDDTDVLDRLG